MRALTRPLAWVVGSAVCSALPMLVHALSYAPFPKPITEVALAGMAVLRAVPAVVAARAKAVTVQREYMPDERPATTSVTDDARLTFGRH